MEKWCHSTVSQAFLYTRDAFFLVWCPEMPSSLSVALRHCLLVWCPETPSSLSVALRHCLPCLVPGDGFLLVWYPVWFAIVQHKVWAIHDTLTARRRLVIVAQVVRSANRGSRHSAQVASLAARGHDTQRDRSWSSIRSIVVVIAPKSRAIREDSIHVVIHLTLSFVHYHDLKFTMPSASLRPGAPSVAPSGLASPRQQQGHRQIPRRWFPRPKTLIMIFILLTCERHRSHSKEVECRIEPSTPRYPNSTQCRLVSSSLLQTHWQAADQRLR